MHQLLGDFVGHRIYMKDIYTTTAYVRNIRGNFYICRIYIPYTTVIYISYMQRFLHLPQIGHL